MSNRKKRSIYYVCSNILNDNLISEVIEASSLKNANNLFFNKFGILPSISYGPFFKKKKKQEVLGNAFKLSSEHKKAHYNGWLVKAFLLKEPIDSALLIFLNRLDNKNILPPKGINIVSISNLRFLDE